jgi:lysophospholipase L1-like esterase
MTRFHSLRRFALALALLILVPPADAQSPRARRIAVWGSSVAFGTGDESNKEGYLGRLRDALAPAGWEVFNQSRPGETIAGARGRWAPAGEPAPNVRYLMTVNPSYVVIALGIVNERILEANGTEAKDAVFKAYHDGIRSFVERARQENVIPIVGLVYPRMAYTPVEYEYLRKANLALNAWDVPTINFLGSVDDGTGRYVVGFNADDRHTNAAGHKEMFHAIVPSLFEALEKGKPQPSRKPTDSGFARISGATGTLMFEPQETMHSFAIGFAIRAQQDGAVLGMTGSKLSASTETKRGGRGAAFESTTLAPAGDFASAILVQNGKWAYMPSNQTNIVSTVNADNQWHHVLLSHYTARGETLFFLDGKLAGKTAERLEPKKFGLGASQADYKDLFIYRSALSADEAAALASGTILQASLEVFAPLTDARFAATIPVENRAQSMSTLKLVGGNIFHVAQ